MRALYLVSKCLPRVCMGGSHWTNMQKVRDKSAPRVHGWFLTHAATWTALAVCPVCAWVVPFHITIP